MPVNIRMAICILTSTWRGKGGDVGLLIPHAGICMLWVYEEVHTGAVCMVQRLGWLHRQTFLWWYNTSRNVSWPGREARHSLVLNNMTLLHHCWGDLCSIIMVKTLPVHYVLCDGYVWVFRQGLWEPWCARVFQFWQTVWTSKCNKAHNVNTESAAWADKTFCLAQKVY